MFILDTLLVGSLRFVLDKVVAAAEAEMQDDTVLREQLLEAQMQLELGEITDAEFAESDKFFKQVEFEDKDLCNAAQKNLIVGTYSAGELEPHQEVGVLYAQKLIREAVMEHRRREKEAGQEIWPARLSLKEEENEDVRFCRELEACSMGNKSVEW